MNTNWENNTVNREIFQRGLNESGQGATLLQSFVNRTVQQLTLREFGLQAVLDRKEGTGQAEIINRRDGLSVANGGVWVADTTAGVDQTGTYAQVSFTYKTLITRGKVTRKLQATGKTYADILALEMSAKAEDFANSLESGLIAGDQAGKVLGGSGGGADANVCNGFITLIQGVDSFSMGQTVNVAGSTTALGAMDLSKLDEAIDLVKGSAQRGDLVIVG